MKPVNKFVPEHLLHKIVLSLNVGLNLCVCASGARGDFHTHTGFITLAL